MPEDLTLTIFRKRVEILEAPDEIRITLDLVARLDPEVVKLWGDSLSILGHDRYIAYRVTGWDEQAKALVARKIDDGPYVRPIVPEDGSGA